MPAIHIHASESAKKFEQRIRDEHLSGSSTSSNGNGKHKENGHTANGFAEHTKPKLHPPDEKLIGVLQEDGTYFNPGADFKTGNWKIASKRNSGIKYLIRDWIPYDMPTGIIGPPKFGKSMSVLWTIVKPLITGEQFFTGQLGFGEPGYVLWCDTERRLAVNLDRAKKWGMTDAEIERILTPYPDILHSIDITNQGELDRVYDVVCKFKCRAVILDSWRGSHAGDENSSKAGVALRNFGKISELTGCAFIPIHHTNKMGPGQEVNMNSGRGTNDFLAAVACQLAIDMPDGREKLNGGWRRLRVLGENLGINPPPIGFRITEKGIVTGPVPERPTNGDGENGKEGKTTNRADCAAWLKVRLKEPGKWYEARPIIDEAEVLGFPETGCLQRAGKELSIEKSRPGKVSLWRRPVGTDDDSSESGGDK